MDWKLISLSGVLLVFHAGALPATRCDSPGAQACIRHMQTALDHAYLNMTHFCSVRDDVMADARVCVTAKLPEGCPLQTTKQINESLNNQIDGYMRYIINCFRVESPCSRPDLNNRAVQIEDCFLDVLDEGSHQEICSSVEEASRCAHDYATGCNISMIFYQRLTEDYQRTIGCGPYARTTRATVPTSRGLPCSSERFRDCPQVNDRYGNDDTASILQDVTSLAVGISNVTSICRRWQNSSETLKCILEVAQRCNMLTFTVSNIDVLIQRLESRCAREATSLLSDETGAGAADIMSAADIADGAEISHSEAAMAGITPQRKRDRISSHEQLITSSSQYLGTTASSKKRKDGRSPATSRLNAESRSDSRDQQTRKRGDSAPLGNHGTSNALLTGTAMIVSQTVVTLFFVIRR